MVEPRHHGQRIDRRSRWQVFLHADVDQVSTTDRRGEHAGQCCHGVHAGLSDPSEVSHRSAGRAVEIIVLAHTEPDRGVENCPGTEQVLLRDMAIGAGADHMNIALAGSGQPDGQRGYGRPVDHGSDEYCGRVAAGMQCCRAVGGGEHNVVAAHPLLRVFQRRVPEIKAVDRPTAPFTSEKHLGLSGQPACLADGSYRPYPGGPVGECRNDCGGSPQNVDDNGDPSRARPLGHTMKGVVAFPLHRKPLASMSEPTAASPDRAFGNAHVAPREDLDHSPAGVDKSGEKVRGMFTEIAPRYDLVNRLLSGGIDVWWRHVTVSRAPPPARGGILDLCTGTGDLALAYAAKASPGVRIVAADFCPAMLAHGIEKGRKSAAAVEWVEADAMELPFAVGEFDLVTVAFGLRNIADTSRGLVEMARVIKPGGRLAILEFSMPGNRFLRSAYVWYFRHVLPFIGNCVARNRSDAYTYLNQSVEEFPSGERLAALVRAAGFSSVTMTSLTGGIATLTIAVRNPADGTCADA